MLWAVGAIIRVPAPGGGFRVWRVIGIFLGGDDQEGVVELETLDRKPNTQGRVCVPVDFVDAAMRSVAVEVTA